MNELWRQAVKFIGYSGIGWLLDFAAYTILGVWSGNLVLNNIISSWLGVTFVFIFATRKVFQNNSKIALRWKYILYILYQAILIFWVSKLLGAINRAIVSYVDWVIICSIAPIIAKVLVTPITMVLNFFVMKSVIERI